MLPVLPVEFVFVAIQFLCYFLTLVLVTFGLVLVR
jgi:hypothetical protein